MNYYDRIYSLLLETPRDPSFRRRKKWGKKDEPKQPHRVTGSTQSCDAKGGCKVVHPNLTHLEYISGKTPTLQFKPPTR